MTNSYMKNFSIISINRYSSGPVYLKTGIAAIILLLLSSLLLLYLFIKERNNNKNLFGLIDRANKDFNQIHESLKQKDLQKAFRYLTEAQEQVAGIQTENLPSADPAMIKK